MFVMVKISYYSHEKVSKIRLCGNARPIFYTRVGAVAKTHVTPKIPVNSNTKIKQISLTNEKLIDYNLVE